MNSKKKPIPSPCPNTGTVRRNPPRRARPTPVADLSGATAPSSNLNHGDVVNFPIQELLSINLSKKDTEKEPLEVPVVEPIQVFLRIRPLSLAGKSTKSASTKVNKNVWPRLKTAKLKTETKNTNICIEVNDSHSVTITPPNISSRMKSEVYNGFSHVFSADVQQDEVFGKMVSPLVEEFLKGKSGLLAALGPSGSGKTHTVFGSTRDPGLVPRAIRHIFDQCLASENANRRTIYLSMFEIYSEGGRAEKLFDLSPNGGEIQLQQNGLKGIKEVLVADYTKADALIAGGLSRRATATTNSNMQSSRSQCIINVRSSSGEIDGMGGLKLSEAVLTFVDLAGAERERKTGNQGDRLLESNFINKNSMVLSLCLRSLLEHQKNPKQPLKKHFQSSVLTRYLRDYLEGKKRMALILTVRPGEEDYLDTSYMLRQASPYMEIKFLNKEESTGNKRQPQTTVGGATDRSKRMKLTAPAASMDTKEKMTADSISNTEETVTEAPKLDKSVKKTRVKTHVNSASTVKIPTRKEEDHTNSGRDREQNIMKGFAKTIWSLLKEYNQELKVARSEIDSLKEALISERTSYSELQSELEQLKLNCLAQHHDVTACSSRLSKEVVENGLEKSDTDNACDGNLEIIPCSKGGENSAEATSLVVSTDCNASGSDLKLVGVEKNPCSKGSAHNSAVDFKLDSGVVNSSDSNARDNDTKLDQLENPDLEDDGGNPSEEEFAVVKIGGVVNLGPADASSEDVELESVDKSCFKDVGNSSEGSEQLNIKELSETSKEHGSTFKGKQAMEASLHGDDENVVCEINDTAEEDDHKGAGSAVESVVEDKAVVAKCEVNNSSRNNLVSESETTDEDSSIHEAQPLEVVKPRRRLMPASTVLLRNYSSMDFTDDERGMRRGGRKLVEEESKRTAGSLSLLRLLKGQQH